jgi:tetratricopeptide (TPR) repeat protein
MSSEGASASRNLDIEAYRLMRTGDFAAALPFAHQAVAGATRCLPAHGMLAAILIHLARIEEAEHTIQAAMACGPGSGDAYDALAHASLRLAQYERSNELYRRAVAVEPDSARLWYNLATSERSFGRLAEAEAACDKAIAIDPQQHQAYLLRAELRPQTEQANHIPELQQRLAQPQLDPRARVALGYALAKELDDLQRFDAAFANFATAARIRRQLLAYDVAVDEHKMERIRQEFAGGAPSASDGDGVASQRFIFVIGLPRSGTTLVERILLGLEGVRSNGETENFARALLAAAPATGRDVFARAAQADSAKVAFNYQQLAAPRHHGPVIEKLPMNYLYLGAICRALPNARLVIVRRSALDSCFAMYRTLFADAYPFSYDFQDLARYYSAYDRLMQHWRSTLGDRMHEIIYEELVAAPAEAGARLAHYCDLTWSAQALDLQKTGGVSLTASASQIRRPIYGTSSGRWRLYRKHLAPLIEALRARGIALPDGIM